MNIPEIVSQLTLEEKASLCSGGDFWHTKAIERLGIPAMMMCDGPHGLRKQNLVSDNMGINDSIPAVCFPAGCATASSFDRALVRQMGEALGNECQAEDVGVILGPAVNIKRSPLCGRNFEYYSEDPYVASQMASSFIQGVQSQNVGTSIKHFYANNQEHRRMSSSSELDERTAREIYLSAFETAIREAKPWTVMCSYNRINGVYAAENRWALTDVLRGEWGFDGFVVSDWGAVNDRVPDLEAGMDLEMPASGGFRDEEIITAVRVGRMPEAVLDQAVTRILTIVDRYLRGRNPRAVFDREKDHALAREIAGQCMVLLKNEDQVLPLKRTQKAAFIGAFAEKPRYQGGGSSHINSFKVESALEMAKDCCVTYAKGFAAESELVDEALLAEAVEAAAEADVAVVFAGLPDSFESEGFDRKHMELPLCQNVLISAVAKANPNTVVVLHNGAPVEMPWISEVKGILETYLCGQAVGGAVIDVLYGEVNPSGHLAETFPRALRETPSYISFQGEGDRVEVSVDVTNTGDRYGKEVVQLYIMPQIETDAILRPVLELRGFEKVGLKSGETKTVHFTLDRRAFSSYNIQRQKWMAERGDYIIACGDSSENLPMQQTVHIEGDLPIPKCITMDTTFGDVLRIPGAANLVTPFAAVFGATNESADENAMGESTAEMMEAMMQYMPIRGLISFGGGTVTTRQCEELIQKLNVLAEAAEQKYES